MNEAQDGVSSAQDGVASVWDAHLLLQTPDIPPGMATPQQQFFFGRLYEALCSPGIVHKVWLQSSTAAVRRSEGMSCRVHRTCPPLPGFSSPPDLHSSLSPMMNLSPSQISSWLVLFRWICDIGGLAKIKYGVVLYSVLFGLAWLGRSPSPSPLYETLGHHIHSNATFLQHCNHFGLRSKACRTVFISSHMTKFKWQVHPLPVHLMCHPLQKYRG